MTPPASHPNKAITLWPIEAVGEQIEGIPKHDQEIHPKNQEQVI